jgi:thymidine phosphorylase
VVLHKRPGDPVRAGDPLYELRAEHAERIPAALAEAERAVRIGPDAPAMTPLVIERIG